MASSGTGPKGAPRSLNEVVKDNFPYGFWRDRPITTLALSSLRLAFDAWFSTYKSVHHKFSIFTSTDKDTPTEDVDQEHGLKYFEAQSEALVHYQHFFELVCKDLLRGEHVLLVNEAQRDPVVLHKLLLGESVTDEELAKTHSISFADVLKHLIKLVKAKRLRRSDLDFISKHENTLSELNKLRNRVWHRGTTVLRYRALDELVGRFLLPVVRAVTELPEYAKSKFWLPRSVACGLDVIAEIEAELVRPEWSLAKVAYLKELGRASYRLPIIGGPDFYLPDARAKERARAAAERLAHPYEIRKCPACGVESLIQHNDMYHDEETGESKDFVWKVECTCCSFTVLQELGSAPALGLPLEDFFV